MSHDPYICKACGGNVDRKGFCERCGAPAESEPDVESLCECAPGRKNPDCPLHGLSPSEQAEALVTGAEFFYDSTRRDGDVDSL
jgi:hypothetical protein